MSESCVFCRIARGEIPASLVYEDDEVIGFHDLAPQAPVHVLLIPRRHVATLLETGPGDVELLGRLQRAAVATAEKRGLDRDGFRLVTNCLAGAGQTVFHLHVHLLGGRLLGWPPG